ncbi:hypothetical protein EV714DRAFT_277198 [Schizophyllum commune]
MPESSISPPSSAGCRPLRHRLLPSWVVRYFSRGRASPSAPIARSAIASSTSASGDDADGHQPHPQPSFSAAIATPLPTSPSPGLRARLSISKLYRRLSRSLAPSLRGSPPTIPCSPEPEPASSVLQVPPSSSSTDGTNLDPPTGSLSPPRTVEACEMTVPSKALISTSTTVVDVVDAPAADPMSKIWNEAVAEWQRKMGVDLTSPEAILFGSKEAVVEYITRMEEESQGDLEKSQWRRLGDTLIPLARAFKKLCAPIGDILSSTIFPPSNVIFAAVGLIVSATVEAHEEFELMTDAFDEIKVHLRVVEIVAAHPGRLLYDSSIELLAQIITVLGVVMQMRREKYAGQFMRALVDIRPLSDSLQGLRRISSRYKEAIIAGTLEVVTHGKVSDELERILGWLEFGSVDSSKRMSSLLNDRAEGTGLWFLDDQTFVNFLKGETKVLSIQGKAGCGKSTIIASATRHLRAYCASRGSTHVVLAHFFDAANNSGRGTLDSLLSSFLCQLALNDQCCMDVLAQTRQRSISNGCFTPQEKLNTLVGMLNGRVHGFLVIDALDEAQALNNEHAKIFCALKKLRSCTNISILVSTRVPLADEDLERDVVSIDRMGDNTDIRTALDIEFSNGGRLFGIAKAEMVRNKLMMKADGNMRWLTLVIEQLRGALNDPRRLGRLLEKLPLSLKGLYGDRLAATNEDLIGDTKLLFAWILYADIPLTTRLLSHVLAFNYDARVPTYDPALLSQHPTSQISGLLDSTFISITEGRVRIAHASVREFLVTLSPSFPFYTSSDDAVCLMVRTSLAYLLAVVTHIHSTEYGDDLLQLWHRCIFVHEGNHYVALEQDIANVLCQIGAACPPESILSPALRSAVAQGHEQLVSLLLTNGADGNIQAHDSYKWSDFTYPPPDPDETVLHLAAEHGHSGVAKLLLERGARIAARTEQQNTPLIVAARNGQEDVIRLLLDKGADIEDCGKDGNTSLHRAAERGHHGTVSLLLDRGARIAARTKQQDTPLTLAACNGQEDVVRLLLDKGADIEDYDKNGWTSLHQAALWGNFSTVSLLLERGANVNAVNNAYHTPLYIATQFGTIDIMRLLVDRGAALEARDEDGWTPLYLAVYCSAEKVMRVLLSLGSDPRTRADDGTTLLNAVGRDRLIPKDAERDARIRELLMRAGCTEETGRIPLENGRYKALAFKALFTTPAETETAEKAALHVTL